MPENNINSEFVEQNSLMCYKYIRAYEDFMKCLDISIYVIFWHNDITTQKWELNQRVHIL